MKKNTISLTAIFLLIANYSYSQNNLAKIISIDAKEQPLQIVLKQLSKKGNFTFSYNSDVIPENTAVTFKADNIMVQDALDSLLQGNFEYKEASNYVVLRACPNSLSLIPEKSEAIGRKYVVSGYIIDNSDGRKVEDASVYEKQLLKSTLTDHQGYFRLKIKSNNQAIRLTIAKDQYKEITVTMLPAVTVDTQDSSKYGFKPESGIVATYFGKIFITSKQRVQSANLNGFYAESPVQFSFVPGLSTNGLYNSQVVNAVSLNALAGYSAGVNGVEVAGLFNVNKHNVKNFQVAGLTNTVGGTVNGVQWAGIGNVVLDSVSAFQIAGIFNAVKSSFFGVQISGIVNANKGNMTGTQLAGIVNLNVKKLKGTQLAGIGNTNLKAVSGLQMAGIYNVATDSVKGVQLAGIVNYAKKVKGFQVGLINIADTLEGASFGLVNLSKNGYHKLAVYSNEFTNLNLALVTGSSKLYTSIRGGYNISDTAKVFSVGLAVGHDFIINKKLAVGSQLSGDQLYLGSWNKSNWIGKAGVNLQVKLVKGIELFAGPYYSMYYSNQKNKIKNYAHPVQTRGLAHHNYDKNLNGWVGFEAGIRLF